MDDYINWGELSDLTALKEPLLSVYELIKAHKDCEFIEVRRISSEHIALVVDVGDGSFDGLNSVGIKRVERLAISHNSKSKFCWDVRALRSDFPLTIHQNSTAKGEPRSICIYFEPWSSIERHWTPQRFIERILWWIRATVDGDIHSDDQPIEKLFFNSPYQLVLSQSHFTSSRNPDLDLYFEVIDKPTNGTTTIVGRFKKNDKSTVKKLPNYLPITMTLPPVENMPIEEYPRTLGELNNIMKSKGGDLCGELKGYFERLVTETGIELEENLQSNFLLIFGIPRKRNGELERMDLAGFLLSVHLGQLGQSLAALFQDPQNKNRWYLERTNMAGVSPSEFWQRQKVVPVEVTFMPSDKAINKYSGISTKKMNGVIAGVGALGSSLVEVWSREKWGDWTLVDNDIVKPHNLVRHTTNSWDVGFSKAKAVSQKLAYMFNIDPEEYPAHYAVEFDTSLAEIKQLIQNTDLVVDATTTLHVPRNMFREEDCPRVASVFLTPNGFNSVLLLEDESRYIRTISLESQYYRAMLIDDTWGVDHLSENLGKFWSGASCRDISTSMSQELVGIHSSIISRQLRLASESKEAKVAVWRYDDVNGDVICNNIFVHKSRSLILDDWEILWDDEIEKSFVKRREKELPDETGGILLGFIDQKLKIISLVIASSAPEDSSSSPVSFQRGEYGVADMITEARRRTANVVDYIGEWHSHPNSCSASPSPKDEVQLSYLNDTQELSGSPAIVLIISADEMSISLKSSNKSFTKKVTLN